MLRKKDIKTVLQQMVSRKIQNLSHAQCGNVGNLPTLQKIFVKSIYSITL